MPAALVVLLIILSALGIVHMPGWFWLGFGVYFVGAVIYWYRRDWYLAP